MLLFFINIRSKKKIENNCFFIWLLLLLLLSLHQIFINNLNYINIMSKSPIVFVPFQEQGTVNLSNDFDVYITFNCLPLNVIPELVYFNDHFYYQDRIITLSNKSWSVRYHITTFNLSDVISLRPNMVLHV